MTDQKKKNKVHLERTADIVSAYVSNNPVPAGELPSLIGEIHKSLTALATGETDAPAVALSPAVPIKKSVQHDHIVCLEDGKKFKSLKRHLATSHGLTPDEYRTRWNLPSNYPMTAPAYSASRSTLAKQIGLGRKPKPQPEPAAAPAKRARKAKGT